MPIALLATGARHRARHPRLLTAAAAVDPIEPHVWQLSRRVGVDTGSPDGIGWQSLLIWHVGNSDVPVMHYMYQQGAAQSQAVFGVSLALFVSFVSDA
jgi:hypothetical protein